LDRPCPAADEAEPTDPELWVSPSARYDRTDAERGKWKPRNPLPGEWLLDCGPFALQLKATPFGHLGVFPEQQSNWDWIQRQVRRHGGAPRVLNLFAYTGASTLAAASAGAEVVHVDSARNVIQWARRNASASELESAPIRWIVEDARRFVQRELRRGNQYDAVVMDPPSYGHGPKGETWKLTRDLLPLLRDCAELTSQRRLFLLLTCHSPGFGPAELSASLEDAVFGHCQTGVGAKGLHLEACDGRRLDAGVVARWPFA
jgi:23S rRNA (cytosine1962-C5)-methyltransferase